MYLESPTAFKPIAPELHKCYDGEGSHDARYKTAGESNLGISELQLVNYKKQPLPHGIANGVGTNQEAIHHQGNRQNSI